MFFFYHGQKGKNLAEITNTIFINVKEEETLLPVPPNIFKTKGSEVFVKNDIQGP